MSIDAWKRRLAQIEASPSAGPSEREELRKVLAQLVGLADEVDAWKATAEHLKRQVQDALQQLDRERAARTELERKLHERVEKLDALAELTRGEVEPLREVIVTALRDQVFQSTPERIDELAREVYRESMEKHGLDDVWHMESPSRRRDIGVALEIVLAILERRLTECELSLK